MTFWCVRHFIISYIAHQSSFKYKTKEKQIEEKLSFFLSSLNFNILFIYSLSLSLSLVAYTLKMYMKWLCALDF
jgi:hypothetical protein